MIILDTDHLSILYRNNSEGFNLGVRLEKSKDQDVRVAIITYEEQMRGWLAVSAKATSTHRQVEAYTKLQEFVDIFREVSLLSFDQHAANLYEQFRRDRIRVGSMDLKIGAIAIANNALLLSRNLSDFKRIPGIRVEDWTQ